MPSLPGRTFLRMRITECASVRHKNTSFGRDAREIFLPGRVDRPRRIYIGTTMRKARQLLLLPQVMALLAFALPSFGPCAGDDDDQPVRPPALAKDASPPPVADAAFSIRLSPRRQQLGGLKTQTLAAFSLDEASRAYGRIVDISPLLDLRARYRAAQSDLAIAEAALRVAQKSHDRLSKLHSESIVPTRELILAESQLASEQARHSAAGRRVREIREEAVQSFGLELFRQAVEADSPLFEGLLSRSLVLALVALPANSQLPKSVRAIQIAPSGEPVKKQARLVSPAPKTEESTQGETWFFVADSAGLRTGMRLDAWIPQGGHLAQGVLIPLSAVVWRDGKPWVYVKTGADAFARRPLESHADQGASWFVADGFKPGEEVVSVGGQMLLSEEQRRGAPSADDD